MSRDRMGNDRKTRREIGRRLRRGGVMMCMMITSAMLLSACKGNSSSQSTTAAQATQAAESGVQDSQNEVMGRVKSVSDTEITVEQGPGGAPNGQGQSSQGRAPDGQNGQQDKGNPPAKLGDDSNQGQSDNGQSSQSGQNSDGQQPGGAPDGKGQPPQGGAPGGQGGQQNQGNPPEKPGNDGSQGQNQGNPQAKPGDGSSQGQQNQGNPPEKPGDDNSQGQSNNSQSGQPGQNSDGQQPGGVPDGQGQSPQGETTTYKITTSTSFTDADGASIKVSDIKEGDFVKITTDEDGNAVQISLADMTGGPDGSQGGPSNGAPGAGGPGGGAQSAPTSYSSVKEFTGDAEESGQSYTSEGTDESAVLVSNGANVTLKDFTVNRTSEDSKGGDSSSFYGIGASVLATDGTVNLNGGTITSDADGAAGAFAYDKGTVNISDTTITTTGNTAGGIHAAGGGTVNAENLTVHTSGESSAAIRSDRGGGTMRVKGGSYTSAGTGSPAVYCTADIEVEDAKLTAENSEAVCIEGLNSLSLTNCDLSGHIQDNDQNDCDWTVILYQSMSGDSEVGNAVFNMTGGSLTSENGGLFYTTNTESTFYLNNVNITPSSNNEFFLKCTGNANKRGWGQSGANGADCSFTAENQKMEGDVIWDSISNLDFKMTNGSTLTGGFIQDESCAGNGGSKKADLSIDATSTWIVTKDSRLASLTNKGTIKDADGKTVTIKGSDGTVYVQGDSTYTVIVDSYNA